tara:strand:- start:299 stop:793 length:495 start_codon:yes stop_codon:yes gene_type:complete
MNYLLSLALVAFSFLSPVLAQNPAIPVPPWPDNDYAALCAGVAPGGAVWDIECLDYSTAKWDLDQWWATEWVLMKIDYDFELADLKQTMDFAVSAWRIAEAYALTAPPELQVWAWQQVADAKATWEAAFAAYWDFRQYEWDLRMIALEALYQSGLCTTECWVLV